MFQRILSTSIQKSTQHQPWAKLTTMLPSMVSSSLFRQVSPRVAGPFSSPVSSYTTMFKPSLHTRSTPLPPTAATSPRQRAPQGASNRKQPPVEMVQSEAQFTQFLEGDNPLAKQVGQSVERLSVSEAAARQKALLREQFKRFIWISATIGFVSVTGYYHLKRAGFISSSITMDGKVLSASDLQLSPLAMEAMDKYISELSAEEYWNYITEMQPLTKPNDIKQLPLMRLPDLHKAQQDITDRWNVGKIYDVPPLNIHTIDLFLTEQEREEREKRLLKEASSNS